MLTSIRLLNFKAFADQTIALRPLTLLSGLNGMGKSSVIQALLLLRQNFETGSLMQDRLALNGSFTHLGTGRDVLFEQATSDKVQIEINFDKGVYTEQIPLQLPFIFRVTTNIALFDVFDLEIDDWLDNNLTEDDFDDIKFVSDYVAELKNDPMDLGNPTGVFSTGFQYLQAERLGPRTSLPTSAYSIGEQGQLGTQGEYTAHFLSVFSEQIVAPKSLHHPIWESEQPPTLMELTTLWLREISPGTRIGITMIPEIDAARLSYSFERSKSVSGEYRPTNVGFGISYVLPVIVALLSAKPGSLIILENPEAHLHPRGQVKMGELIARAADAGIQVLVETHSDHVLNGIRIAVKNGLVEPDAVALHFFQRPNDDDGSAGVEVVTPKLDDFGKLSFRPDGFFDQFDRSLDELL